MGLCTTRISRFSLSNVVRIAVVLQNAEQVFPKAAHRAQSARMTGLLDERKGQQSILARWGGSPMQACVGE
jgi:hypothetical protein